MDKAALDVVTAVIVEDLMTVGNQRAARLELVDDRGRDLGGWNAPALQHRIRQHLETLEDATEAR